MNNKIELLIEDSSALIIIKTAGCVAEYFKKKDLSTNENEDEEANGKLQGFKCVLNSKGTEESMVTSLHRLSMGGFITFLFRSSRLFAFWLLPLLISQANLARWEPSHGSFNFRHPWKLYVKIGAAMRRCAYCLENLSICINYETEVTFYT